MEAQPKALDSYEQAAEQRIRGIEPSQDDGMHDKKAVLTAKLEDLAKNLLKKRDEAVAFRAASGVERRWLEDTKAFDGLDATSGGSNSMLDYASGAAPARNSKKASRSKVLINILRGKTQTATGRFGDTLLPSDDRNWAFITTPVPELIDLVKNRTAIPSQSTGESLQKEDGSDLTVSDLAKEQMDIAKKKCKAMETEIDDQLNECGFNVESRKAIRMAAKLGTGILKGPNVVKRVKKAWMPQTSGNTTVHVLQVKESSRPATKSIDPWNVYPDQTCGSDPKKGSYIWEKDDHVLPRELQDLIGIDGYFEDQIRLVLDEEPKRTTAKVDKGGAISAQTNMLAKGAPYERWEYHGDLDKEDLEILGCNCMSESKVQSACVVFVNDRPIKVMLNPLDTGDTPYDFFQWCEVADSPWGIGVPRLGIWEQRVVTGGWRALMNNAGDSAGAQIVMNKGVVPADGIREFSSTKIWIADGDVDDVRGAFGQFQLQSRQAELTAIIELGMKFADEATQIPALSQGQERRGPGPETLGGAIIRENANNVANQERVKRWDDQITRPHLTRYYDWNMQYNPKSEIKGEFEVDPRGTSVLLVKDQQAQSLGELINLRNDPQVSLYVDWQKAITQLFALHRLDVMKSEDEIALALEEQKKQQPQPPPQIAVAQINAQNRTEIAQMTTAASVEKSRIDTDRDTAYVEAETQRANDNAQAKREELQVKYQIAVLEYANREKLSLEKAKVELAKLSMTLGVQKELAAQDARMEQVATPAVEPAGRAQPGHAFTQ